MDLLQLAERLASAPTVVLLLLIIFAGAKEWWVWGTTYRAALADRDEWKRIAMESTGLVRVATKAVREAGGA